jgi:serine phosphatase RsbU (regulator of sigma subunit)
LPFTENTIFYLFSDGYADEIGGEEDKKFSTKKFKQLLLEISEQTLEKQKEILEDTIKKWLIKSKQIDDILVLGVKCKKNSA